MHSSERRAGRHGDATVRSVNHPGGATASVGATTQASRPPAPPTARQTTVVNSETTGAASNSAPNAATNA